MGAVENELIVVLSIRVGQDPMEVYQVLSGPESDSKPFLSGLITPLVTDEDTEVQSR